MEKCKCGLEPEIEWVKDEKVSGFRVVCPSCGGKEEFFETREEAIEAWNADK